MGKLRNGYEWLCVGCSELLSLSCLLSPKELNLLLIVLALGKKVTSRLFLDTGCSPSGESPPPPVGARLVVCDTTRRQLSHFLGPSRPRHVSALVSSLVRKGVMQREVRPGRGYRLTLNLASMALARVEHHALEGNTSPPRKQDEDSDGPEAGCAGADDVPQPGPLGTRGGAGAAKAPYPLADTGAPESGPPLRVNSNSTASSSSTGAHTSAPAAFPFRGGRTRGERARLSSSLSDEEKKRQQRQEKDGQDKLCLTERGGHCRPSLDDGSFAGPPSIPRQCFPPVP